MLYFLLYDEGEVFAKAWHASKGFIMFEKELAMNASSMC